MELRDYLRALVQHSARPIYLTGKAGTGKTTLLRQIVQETYKQCIVTAPTGIAALNAGGVTLHSLFQIAGGFFLPEEPRHRPTDEYITPKSYWRQNKMTVARRQLLTRLELLIIDEVSMLRADLLDLIDHILRRIRKSQLPFGGVQVLFIGDLLQLPPVVRPSEWTYLAPYYEGLFFFQSRVLRETPLVHIELSKIYRQKDESFVEILGELRHNYLSTKSRETLAQYVHPHILNDKEHKHIILTTHNAKADAINQKNFDALPSSPLSYLAHRQGDFPERLFPCPETLTLKEGCRVTFLKNNARLGYYNGSIGQVERLIAETEEGEEAIWVRLEDSGELIRVERYQWENRQYSIDPETGEATSSLKGSFTQYPLRLAWAITIHKSQGLTFDNAILDLEQVFSPGQAYVALSRLRSLSGLILSAPLQLQDLSTPKEVEDFGNNTTPPDTLEQLLAHERRSYWCDESLKTMNWRPLLDLWQDHSYSYRAESERSVKSSHGDWASETTATVSYLCKTANTFSGQLYQLWHEIPLRLGFLAERCAKASEFFLPQLAEILLEIDLRLKQLPKRNTKEFRAELEELRSATIDHARRLLRLERATALLATGEVFITAELLDLEAQFAQWHKAIKDKLAELCPEEVSPPKDKTPQEATPRPKRRAKADRTPSPPKERTQDLTLALFNAGKLPVEIADERGLTLDTIYKHLTYLMLERKIAPSALFDPEEADEVLDYLEEHPEIKGLKEVYEAFEERYAYHQLHLYFAYRDLQQQKNK